MTYTSKNEIVFQLLREEILEGKLIPGTRYSATEIAEQLQISKTPVNYAILLLAEQGLITMLPNVGFEVKELAWREIEELMYIKNAMHKLALGWLMQVITKEDIAEFKKYLEKIKKSIEKANEKAYFMATKEFYFSIARKAGAKRCLDYYEKYWDYEGWYAVKIQENKHGLLALCQGHEKLIAALEGKDIPSLNLIADEHLEKSLILLKATIRI